MTDAREIIAGAIAYPNKACGTALMDETLHDWQARAVSAALASAGFRIISKDELARLAELGAERDLLQDILDSRPAINEGLPDSYIRWSQAIYSGDFIRAIGRKV